MSHPGMYNLIFSSNDQLIKNKSIIVGPWIKIPLENRNEFIFLKTPLSNVTTRDNHYSITDSLYEVFLTELANILNCHHNEFFSLKFYRIIIGPWLRQFIDII